MVKLTIKSPSVQALRLALNRAAALVPDEDSSVVAAALSFADGSSIEVAAAQEASAPPPQPAKVKRVKKVGLWSKFWAEHQRWNFTSASLAAETGATASACASAISSALKTGWISEVTPGTYTVAVAHSPIKAGA